MALLTAENISISGLEATYSAVAASDTFSNTGDIIIHVVNGDASDNTVTVVTPKTVAGLAVADVSVTVTAGESRFIGPFDPAVFNNGSGIVTVQHSNTTSNTIALIRI